MKLKLLPFLIALGMAVTGCTVHRGQLVDLNHGKAVDAEDQAIGYASATYVFGIGGNSSNVLLKEAKDNLIENRPLRKGERYANVNLNISTSYYLIFSKTRFILSADVVSDENENGSASKLRGKFFFQLGDEVIYSDKDSLGEFMGKADAETAIVKRTAKRGHQKFEVFPLDQLFRNHGKHNGFSVGQEVSYSGKFTGKGKIVGLGPTTVLIEDKANDRLANVAYDKIERSAK